MQARQLLVGVGAAWFTIGCADDGRVARADAERDAGAPERTLPDATAPDTGLFAVEPGAGDAPTAGTSAGALPGRIADADARPGSARNDATPAGTTGDATESGSSASPGAADRAAPEEPPIDFASLPQVRDADFEIGVEPVPAEERVPRPEHVRGIYVNAWSAGSERRRAALLRLADTTEINAFVIDVKDVTGQVSYRSSVPLVEEIGANRDIRIADVRRVLSDLERHGIYPIARIVAFKDPVLARERPDWSIQTADRRVWRDHNDEMWVDAYNEQVWRYNLALAREAAALGFAEIQWDYIRFPDVPGRYMASAVYPARDGRQRTDAIRAFMRLSSERLREEFDVPVTADVFGATTSAGNDIGIGQEWEKMADVVDVLLPMVYPSHYPRGSFGIAHPNADPYQTLVTALGYGVRRSARIEDAALIRPWIQDFSLGDPPYGPAHVRAQIRAVYDSGLSEWILWNPSSRYTEEALADEYGNEPFIPGLFALVAPADSLDVLGVDPRDARDARPELRDDAGDLLGDVIEEVSDSLRLEEI